MSDLEPSVAFKPGNESGQIEIKDVNPIVATSPTAPPTPNVEAAEKGLEKLEIEDKIMPIKPNYENKAFELEDVEIGGSKEGAAAKSEFDRKTRPGSMMSIRSSASTTSRSSVNCTSGRVRCPNLRLKKFFSYKPDGGFQRASEDIKQLILPDKDGSFVGAWLLVEISSWDLHREKVVMLTDKTLIVVSYDFIKLRIYEYKRISLAELKKVYTGSLKYPSSSMMGEYLYGAVKISWGIEENLSFFDRWNPLSEKVPYTMFTSHHILYNEKEKETEIYNCDEFVATLEYVISKLPEASSIEIKEEPIEIASYANIFSVLYNQNWIGFQLDRNGVNF